ELVTTEIHEIIHKCVLLAPEVPHYCCWWNKDLNKLKARSRKLSRCAYNLRGNPGHPIHAESRRIQVLYADAIKVAKRNHWEVFLPQPETASFGLQIITSQNQLEMAGV
ncbi:hypothetical protein BDV98DRAFT_515688, partial [Pterulicium gracile]